MSRRIKKIKTYFDLLKDILSDILDCDYINLDIFDLFYEDIKKLSAQKECDTQIKKSYTMCAIGALLILDCEYDEAEDYLNRSIKNNENSYAHYYKGVIYRFRNKIDVSIEEFKRAILLNESLTVVYNELAFCHLRIKDYKAAYAYFNTYTNYVDGESIAYIGMAHACIGLGNLDEAEKFHKLALNINEGSTELWSFANFLFYKRDDAENAEKYFKRAISKEDGNGESYFYYGLFYLNLKRNLLAKEMLLKAINLGYKRAENYIENID